MRLNRRRFVQSGCAAIAWSRRSFSAAARPSEDVDWLTDIQQPPQARHPKAPRVKPLLREDGQAITTGDAWQQKAAALRRWWNEFLGEPPAPRSGPPPLRILEEVVGDGMVRQRIEYPVEPGITTQAYLFRPKSRASPAPGLIALHSTVQPSINEPAGLHGPDTLAFGPRFAQRGWTVICPRNFLWPDNDHLAAQRQAADFLQRHPRSKGMRKMLHDAQVSVDLLASLPGVDASRLAAVGHSLGAKETMYLAAFDERIQVGVASEGGIGLPFTNWDAPWYLGPSIREPDFDHEHHEILALIAPKPFLILAGESADGDFGWPLIDEALGVYRLFTDRPRFGQWNHREGHRISPASYARLESWLTTYV